MSNYLINKIKLGMQRKNMKKMKTKVKRSKSIKDIANRDGLTNKN